MKKLSANKKIAPSQTQTLASAPIKAKATRNKRNYISLQTAQQMILRFLDIKKMKLGQLAKELNIDIDKLRNLSVTSYKRIMPELSSTLTDLYCRTKW